jgi:hypothetical protein
MRVAAPGTNGFARSRKCLFIQYLAGCCIATDTAASNTSHSRSGVLLTWRCVYSGVVQDAARIHACHYWQRVPHGRSWYVEITRSGGRSRSDAAGNATAGCMHWLGSLERSSSRPTRYALITGGWNHCTPNRSHRCCRHDTEPSRAVETACLSWTVMPGVHGLDRQPRPHTTKQA